MLTRTKWLVAYTLHNNPAVAAYRIPEEEREHQAAGPPPEGAGALEALAVGGGAAAGASELAPQLPASHGGAVDAGTAWGSAGFTYLGPST
jgi:hypothetical protein